MSLAIGQSYNLTFAFFVCPVPCVIVSALPSEAGYAVRVPSGAVFAARWGEGLAIHD